MDRGDLQATVHRGYKESDTTEQLSTHTHTTFQWFHPHHFVIQTIQIDVTLGLLLRKSNHRSLIRVERVQCKPIIITGVQQGQCSQNRMSTKKSGTTAEISISAGPGMW